VKELIHVEPRLANIPLDPLARITPLIFAVMKGKLEICRILIRGGADVRAVDSDDNTALHFAQTSDIARLLVDAGGDISANNKNNLTPLHGAAYRGNRDVVQLLLQYGASADCTSESGETPADLASNKDLSGYLRDVDQRTGPHGIRHPLGIYRCLPQYMAIIEAVAGGDIAAVRFLIEKNPHLVECRGSLEDYTPLHWAAKEGNIEIAQLLMSKGANPMAKDRSGHTPIDLANSKEMVKILRRQ
jgi:ankyrin repeat protein